MNCALGSSRDLCSPLPFNFLGRQRVLFFLEAAQELGCEIRTLVERQPQRFVEYIPRLFTHQERIPLHRTTIEMIPSVILIRNYDTVSRDAAASVVVPAVRTADS